jgi:hypothetical protein
MLTALIALIGVFLSLYLTLFKLGYIGTLACGTGSCETVQLSKWGDFLGLPSRPGASATMWSCSRSRSPLSRSDSRIQRA